MTSPLFATSKERRAVAGSRHQLDPAAWQVVQDRIIDQVADHSLDQNQVAGDQLAIARALVGGPAVVLADEPTGNLDSATGAAIITLLANLASDGTAIVVVTHDESIAAAMDRRVMMRDGRIISDTPARDQKVPRADPAGSVLSGELAS